MQLRHTVARRPRNRSLKGNIESGFTLPQRLHVLSPIACVAAYSNRPSCETDERRAAAAVSRFRQLNCDAVRRRWQFAHRTSHFAISARTRIQDLCVARMVTEWDF